MTPDALTKLIAEAEALIEAMGFFEGSGYRCDRAIGTRSRTLLPELVSVITAQAAEIEKLKEESNGRSSS